MPLQPFDRPFDLACDFTETIDFGELKVPVAYLAQQCEGARSRYWAADFEWRLVDPQHDITRRESVSLTTRVLEIQGKAWITCDWRRAVVIAVMHHAWLLDPYRMDATSGDVWLQLAAFGEVRY